jgi:hypothetical protein
MSTIRPEKKEKTGKQKMPRKIIEGANYNVLYRK